ncbi:Y+L amino acid transporter [Mycoblastus sanguinarius]|nr:Y+L amino acid transporter [Mycoblastus sanguinarius]
MDGHLEDLDSPGVSESFSPFVVDYTLSSTDPQAQGHGSLTFVNGIALVLGLQIGSGIFSAPSQVSNHVPSPGAAILVWFLGGIMVWTGAASFIELGLAIPKNGGIQEYLKACYGDYLGFLFTWIWIAISKPCAMAMIAMIFAENLSVTALPAGLLSAWGVKTIAILGLILITFINCLGTMAGARAANAFLLLKLLAVFSIVATGIVVGVVRYYSHELELEWFASDPDPRRQTMPNWTKAGEYITAIYGALFCYGGWESVSITESDFNSLQLCTKTYVCEL